MSANLHNRSYRNALRQQIEEALGENAFDQFVRAAEVDLNIFKNACDRVYIDGYYGPVSEEDWREQDGREPASFAKALEIVDSVISEVRDVPESNIVFCDLGGGENNECEDPERCDGHHVITGLIGRKDFLRAYLPWYAEIFGGW